MPEIGRYIEKDPIGFRGGINKYVYVTNRATMLVDPLGLEGCGPGEIGDWFIPDSPFGFDFMGACNNHDRCYGCDGKRSGKSKFDCDWEFYQDMLKECAKVRNPYRKAFCDGLAYNYYSKAGSYDQGRFDKARAKCCS